ncbi:MAG TPA: hypothetical protein VFF98_06145 [Novosphingobium sp.]|nr:hypothetical protein [Novosphingobium sp.]
MWLLLHRQKLIAWATGLALLATALAALCARGAWYDEFYTFYVTRPGLSFAQGWPVWLRDNHPPLFYALAWASNGLGQLHGGQLHGGMLGEGGVGPRRLVNLAFLLGGMGALAWLAVRRAPLRLVLLAYGLGLASNYQTINRVAELRSYALVLVSGAVALVLLADVARPGARVSRSAWAALVAALAVALSVHLVASVVMGALGLAFGLRLLLARDWPAARALALAGVLAVLPFAASMALQWRTMAANTASFWIPPGLSAARWAVENEVLANLAGNRLLSLAGLAGLALVALRDLRARRLSGEGSLVLTLAGGVALAVALLVALHLHRPFIINRYLVCLHPPLTLALAVGYAALARALRPAAAALLDGALFLATLWALHAHYVATIAQPSWEGTARAIAAATRACPATLVYANTSWNAPTLDLPPPDNRAVVPFAYGWVAAHHGFALTPIAARRLSPTCPTLFWTEHVAGQYPSAEAVAQRLREGGFAVPAGQLRRYGEGWVFSVNAR